MEKDAERPLSLPSRRTMIGERIIFDVKSTHCLPIKN